ncbi:cysteine hydrolase family protein [Actinomadura parmotrematis]|uniref:Cysteine hydrolase n=1 Tax=Actinomadura parmotrematis TaxID=2864039 RepID=A0ABS7FPJ6_9ACTN|nr:cysteine hydrolase [Actinomadura parmotrematis]MBW8482299.1 cysteine hydrolase [Actinomadura parmotrematis]
MDQVLLVMDVQRAVVDALGDRAAAYTARLGATVAAARAAGVPVVHVVLSFRAGHPEIAPDNHGFRGLADADALGPGDPGAEIHPAVAPLPGEPVVAKHFYGAFAGTDLDTLLRAAGVRRLVLAGLATSGVVLSAQREAVERQYPHTVLSDGCDDPDPELHTVLMDRVLARTATVLTCAEWTAALPAG